MVISQNFNHKNLPLNLISYGIENEIVNRILSHLRDTLFSKRDGSEYNHFTNAISWIKCI